MRRFDLSCGVGNYDEKNVGSIWDVGGVDVYLEEESKNECSRTLVDVMRDADWTADEIFFIGCYIY